jgi:hypothetical protein
VYALTCPQGHSVCSGTKLKHIILRLRQQKRKKRKRVDCDRHETEEEDEGGELCEMERLR